MLSFRSKNPLPRPSFDPDLGDPKLTELREITAARDWLSLEFFFEQVDNWDDQSHYVKCFGEFPGTEDWLVELSQREDQGTLAPLLLASRRIAIGWEIRTGYRAKYVKSEQFAGFHNQLGIAEAVLHEITSVEPDNVAAWFLRIATARGLQLGQAEATLRYAEVAGHSPHHLNAQLSYLQQLCPKWGGSFEQVQAFARDCSLAAPPGGQHGELVAWAHLEQGAELGDRYFAQPEVLADLHAAAARSVLHPDFKPGPRSRVGHNVFALAFSLAGDHSAALEQFRRLGVTATLTPWENFCAPASDGFTKAWSLARRKG
jgi:hypothetical protein